MNILMMSNTYTPLAGSHWVTFAGGKNTNAALDIFDTLRLKQGAAA